MNTLLEQRQAQIDKIYCCVCENVKNYDNFLTHKNEIKAKKDVGFVKKAILRAKLKKEFQDKKFELKDKEKALTNIKDAKILFYVGTSFMYMPTDNNLDQLREENPEDLISLNYYYSYDKDSFCCVSGYPNMELREKFNDEIDVSSQFQIHTTLFGEIKGEYRMEIEKKLSDFVEEIIINHNPQSWDELRQMIIKSLEHRKNNLKKMEEYVIAQ